MQTAAALPIGLWTGWGAGLRSEHLRRAQKYAASLADAPAGKSSEFDDSYIRKAAIKYKVPYLTTVAAAVAAGSRARRCRAAPGSRSAARRACPAR